MASPPPFRAASATASNAAVRRLRREMESLKASHNPQIIVRPSEESLLELHFVIHALPSDSPFHGGCYHGKLVFPSSYPLEPPSILMLTPSGRFQIQKRLCLSMSDWHPESWNPAWGVETILTGFTSFFLSDTEHGIGTIVSSPEEKKRLALASRSSNAEDHEFCALFPELFDTHEGPEPSAVEGQVPCGDNSNPPSPGADGPRKSAADGSVNEASTGTDGACEAEEEPQECWICREDSSNEPLIHPCACRGSMSGVHASCVQQWIRARSRNARSLRAASEAPRCSVCQQPYCGREDRPGPCALLRHECRKAFTRDCFGFVARQGLFALFLVTVEGENPFVLVSGVLAILFSAAVLATFAVVALHKVLVLALEMPLGHSAPPRLRELVAPSRVSTDLHAIELGWWVTMMGLQCLQGRLSPRIFLSVLVVVLLPLAASGCPVLLLPGACCQFAQAIVWSILLFPLELKRMLCASLQRCWAIRGSWAHPLSAGPHIVVAIAASFLGGVWCPSRLPVLVLWSLHSALLLVALTEATFVQSWRWRTRCGWPLALVLSWEAALLSLPVVLVDHGPLPAVAGGLSAVWVCLVTALAVRVNWVCIKSMMRGRYAAWQRQHGTFHVADGGPPTQGAAALSELAQTLV